MKELDHRNQSFSRKYDEYIRAIARATGQDLLVSEAMFVTDVTRGTRYSPEPIPENVVAEARKDINEDFDAWKEKQDK